MTNEVRQKAQISTNAIERLYIGMRHLFMRGFYKPSGVSGQSLRNGLVELSPEIYGSIADPKKFEMAGLLYVIDRLPKGIEECRYIHLTLDEGYRNSTFVPIIPKKRRRYCYRIDHQQMNIVVTRGRSEIYDILTHLTFLYNEARKIVNNIYNPESKSISYAWKRIEKFITREEELSVEEREVILAHIASFLGRSFEEVYAIYEELKEPEDPERFIKFVYHLGNTTFNDKVNNKNVEITFSPMLRDEIGHHIHGDKWANKLKKTLYTLNIGNRPLHIISANMHSVMNSIYAEEVIENPKIKGEAVFLELSKTKNVHLRDKVQDFALQNGMQFIYDESGTNIDVQIFDFNDAFLKKKYAHIKEAPVLLVMDYAFGEQAYETMDELLKPLQLEDKKILFNIDSISIMGKAGILTGEKGDIMIPSAHIFEGTADNYPFKNELTVEQFKGINEKVFDGSMLTVLGTSLQNKYLLEFFKESTWRCVGLEMEGAHYQKAIQAAAMIRNTLCMDVKLRYAYYASDNPLESGSTLSSGGLGEQGVAPTYKITQEILRQILN